MRKAPLLAITKGHLFVVLGVLFSFMSVARADSAALGGPVASRGATSRFRLSPQNYFGDRGTEPRAQFVGQAVLDWDHSDAPEHPWKVSLHWEGELRGRRDVSFDLDRAWWETPLGSSRLILGRAHPWEFSQNPEGLRPWGYLAQWQAQNRGILLGDGFRDSVFPQPVLLGWFGVHFWNTRNAQDSVQWGVSASPIFVPTMGSEVSLSENQAMSASRFGRRSFGSVVVNGATFPLRFRIDQSRVLQDIVFQPQVMGQVRLRLLSGVPDWTQWISVSRAPDCDPSTETSGFIRVVGSDVAAVAEVVPRFPERWVYSFGQEVRFGQPRDQSFTLFSAIQARDDGAWGFEFGSRYSGFEISLLDQVHSPPRGDSASARADYSQWLLQLEGEATFLGMAWFAGWKHHLLRQQDRAGVWLRGGVRKHWGRGLSTELGGDVFGGGENSYFGEWRSNDRVFFVFRWQVPS